MIALSLFWLPSVFFMYQAYLEYNGLGGLLGIPWIYIYTLAFALLLLVSTAVFLFRRRFATAATCLAFVMFAGSVTITHSYTYVFDLLRLQIHKAHYTAQLSLGRTSDSDLMITYWGGFGFLDTAVSRFLVYDEADSASSGETLSDWKSRAPLSFTRFLDERQCNARIGGLIGAYSIVRTSCFYSR